MTESCRPAENEITINLIIYIIQGIYGISSCIVYFLNIKALHYHRNNLDRTFSLLYTSCAAMSILYFLDHYLIRRFVKLGYFCEEILEAFSEPTYFLNPYKTISSYCPIVILVFHCLIAIHRFCVVAMPVKGVQVWDKYRRVFTLIGYLIPLFFMWFMIPCKSYAEVDTEGIGGLDIEYVKVFSLSSSFFAAWAAAIFGVLTLGFTIWMLILLSKMSFRKMKSTEASLIIFEVFMTASTMVYAFTEAMLYYSIHVLANKELKATIIHYRNFAIDIFILPQAWTLLFLSKTVRLYLFRFCGRKIGMNFSSSNDYNNSNRKITRVASSFIPNPDMLKT
ncbi:unnamed protein product [Caenorhabditis angaria]|uniref:Serpentine receptor class gamma n=1 Tax=Caenorhabditis angaria TaxID=860376 RepID=A0A9P1IB95_9PELO|nr:unnamed protein product [Caenorhabditis angaria]